eukprot:SAG11_NODE_474_length_9142_cov_6.507907_13_plen_76_part_00
MDDGGALPDVIPHDLGDGAALQARLQRVLQFRLEYVYAASRTCSRLALTAALHAAVYKRALPIKTHSPSTVLSCL